MSLLTLFHAAGLEIPSPDIHYGRKNADFAQGFYTSDSREFAVRWAPQGKGITAYLNRYELDTEGLEVRKLERDKEWFAYIFRNRTGYADLYPEADVIIGPIANDTLFDTFGVLTSGMLTEDQALAVLLNGPLYEQIVIKTEKAASRLAFKGAEKLEKTEIDKEREAVKQEEAEFQALFAKLIV